MQLRFKYLTVCTLSIMLMACGGSEGDGSDKVPSGGTNELPGDGTNELPGDGTNELPGDGTNELPGDGTNELPPNATPETPGSIPVTPIEPDTSIPLIPIGSSTPVKYPEPKKDIIDNSILGFFDFNKFGDTRQIRNDLMGGFSAMVQFAQSHVVNPKNNESQFLPRLTTEKDALLLVTPTAEMGNPEQLNAEIYFNNQLIKTLRLKEPSRIALTDQSNAEDRPRVRFSKRAWSAALKWNEVRPGLSIRIVDPISGKNGDLRSEDIDFAAPGELVVQSIRLGLLTDQPKSTGHYMLLEPEKAGTDYFQTIPAARMIVSKYEDMKLDKVMVASGVIYDSMSATKGDVYSGDMRENTAKSTFSVGINLANWGITSSSMMSQEQPQLTQSVVIHHARGKYTNGDVNHGLSGGNSILTLYDSVGNEFSHEIGHHYGLGHYPGAVGENLFWAAHHADSGWGYIAFRNKMRGNLNWGTTTLWDGTNGIPNFQDKYAYGRDAMAGGSSASSISRYTHYTGYSTQQKIQPAFDRHIWAEDSVTGYKKWNPTTRIMEVSQPKVPTKSSNVWYNSTDGNYLKPRLFSVPVYTIVGGYDPVNQSGLIYPAARGNWGNVFDLPQANTGGTAASCWLKVQSASGVQNIALAPQRMNPNLDPNNLAVVNKFHINLAQSEQPQAVDLYCQKSNEQAVKLSSINIPLATDVMSPYVSIGQEEGYSALKRIEMPELEQAFLQNKGKEIVNLSPTFRLFYDSYRRFKDEFSPDAQTEMVRYTQQQIKTYRLNRWVNVYYNDLSNGNTEALEAFHKFVDSLGLKNDIPFANARMLVMPKMGNSCLKVEKLDTGILNVYMSGKNGCTGEASTLWVHDAIGKIHSQQYPNLCLTNSRTLSACSNEVQGQVWEVTVNVDTQQLRQGNSCLDLKGGYTPSAAGRGEITMYGCGNGNNQKWSIVPQSHSLILALSNGKNLPLLSKILAK
ncbi:M66 family metalloprotease [Acinetobacter sp. TSRC1-2]|uniref:M66 family metalloprotease n=1 Tax=unclassified Acinetobacter TaxID=196816 RepID=UPI003CECA0E6